ncbi:MAG: monovalent cation/H(+) antiporter subunit G [Hydrococcus sp. SU_1_0]|nr:monovalent cation/H(+) antiporter subunit G [Hydrococcus sp. SU_1_0]
MDIFSYSLIIIGLIFWFWGTLPLISSKSVLVKLHSLSVADTLGSIAMLVGLLLKIPGEWSLLLLAIITLTIWNTILGYVIAYCSDPNSRIITSQIEQD